MKKKPFFSFLTEKERDEEKYNLWPSLFPSKKGKKIPMEKTLHAHISRIFFLFFSAVSLWESAQYVVVTLLTVLSRLSS